jgi:NitT/TauT family transport system substrate-binding protein
MKPTTRRTLLLAAAGAVVPFALARRVRAQAQPTVTYGLTSKTANDWINHLSDSLGFFSGQGIHVDFIDVGSAAANGQQMAAGSLDMGGIASPNLIQAVIGGAPLAVVLARTRVSPYLILAKKGYKSMKDLKDKTIIVDSPSGITRLMVDGVLEANHMKSSDVTYTYAGGTPERFAALLSGAVDAAMLLPPFSFRAIGQGFPVVAEIPKVFPTLPVDQTGANTKWAKANTPALLGYLRGYLQGLHWIYEPANRTKSIAMLTDWTGSAPDDASKTYNVYVRGKVFSETGITTVPGEAKVLEMLASVGQIPAKYPPAAQFVDNSYLQQATAQLKKG